MTKRQGFYTTTPAGNPAHILGDVDMPDELLAALHEMIDCVANGLANGTLGKRRKMQGKRAYPNEEGHLLLAPGEYGLNPQDGQWYARPPQNEDGFYSGMGSLASHEVTEHEDGTITVSPSILITGHHDKQWHGYLERGIWRKV